MAHENEKQVKKSCCENEKKKKKKKKKKTFISNYYMDNSVWENFSAVRWKNFLVGQSCKQEKQATNLTN